MLFDAYMVVFSKNGKRLQNFNKNKLKFSILNYWEASDTINDGVNQQIINTKYNFNTTTIVKDKLKGKLGCNLSHQLLWKHCLSNSRKEWFLITEDDVIIQGNEDQIKKQIDEMLVYCNTNDIHYIQLDVRHQHKQRQLNCNKLLIKDLYEMSPQCGTGAYLINRVGINIMLDITPWNKYIDVHLNDVKNMKLLKSACLINEIFVNKGNHRQIDKNTEFGSILYNKKS